jgi:hypothetical protein
VIGSNWRTPCLIQLNFDILHALLAIWRRMTTLGLWTPDLLAREFLSS